MPRKKKHQHTQPRNEKDMEQQHQVGQHNAFNHPGIFFVGAKTHIADPVGARIAFVVGQWWEILPNCGSIPVMGR